MGCVISTNADCVAFARINKFLVARIKFNIVNAVSFAESLGFAGNKVCGGNNLNIGAFLISLDMSLGNPTRSDNADLELFAVISDFFV